MRDALELTDTLCKSIGAQKQIDRAEMLRQVLIVFMLVATGPKAMHALSNSKHTFAPDRALIRQTKCT